MAEGLIGGTAPQPVVDEGTVRALGTAILRVAQYLRGNTAGPTPSPTNSSLSAVDAAFVDAVDMMLSAATATEAPSDPHPAASIYDTTLAAITSASTTWSRTDAYLALARLAGVARAIERRVVELAGPAKKGKKRPAALVQLGVALRSAREALARKQDEIARTAEGPASEVGAGLVDGDVASACRENVKSARADLRAGVGRLLAAALKQ